MNWKLFLISALIFVAIVFTGFIQFAQAPRPLIGFIISLPEEVEASPGETVIINGSVLNIGRYWLHNFNISVSGLPENFEVKVVPHMFKELRILREWNPQQGVYRVPEKFLIEIKVPEGKIGAFLINVTGKEWGSWRRVENSTLFILTVSMQPKLSVSNIVVPEEVFEFKPFNISFDVKNEGLGDWPVSLKVITPEDWKVEPKVRDIVVNASSSHSVVFTLTPTDKTGNISILIEYPYKKEILKLTKTGPFIIPAKEEIVEKVEVPTALASLAEFVKTNPVVTVIAIILVMIIFWNVWQIVKHAEIKKVRKKPEEIVEVESKPKL
ncbi:MAG: hypothetical protein QW423_00485 [Candidatus Aenigmatarchaeota archaeon]